MTTDDLQRLERRVARAAEAALAEGKFVTPIDVLVGVGWLPPRRVDEWHQGRLEYLECAAQVNVRKLSAAIAILRRWAEREGLEPSEIAYVARTRDRRPLRFSESGNPGIERAYRTHWVSPELSERQRQRLAERLSRPPDLVVISPLKDWTCTACGGTGDFLFMEEPGPVCLPCADMDHLVFLRAGDAALTRRASKHSGMSAVVVRFSRSTLAVVLHRVGEDLAQWRQADSVRVTASMVGGIRAFRAVRAGMAILASGYELEADAMSRVLLELFVETRSAVQDASGETARVWLSGGRERGISSREPGCRMGPQADVGDRTMPGGLRSGRPRHGRSGRERHRPDAPRDQCSRQDPGPPRARLAPGCRLERVTCRRPGRCVDSADRSNTPYCNLC